MEEKQIEIVCPNCQGKSEKTIYPLIELQHNPLLKQEVLSLIPFQHRCEHCQKIIPLLYPLIYHDPHKKVMIALQTPTNTYLAHDYIGRIVETPDQLREKILLFDHNYDDRIIELVKWYYLAKLNSEAKALEVHTVLYNYNKKEQQDEFVFITKNSEPFRSAITQEIIDLVKNRYYKILSQPMLGTYQHIDSQWALDIINDHQ